MLSENLLGLLSRVHYQEIFVFGVALVIGYVAANFFAGKEEGEQGRVKSVRIRVKDYVFHIHHWFYAAAIMVALGFACAKLLRARLAADAGLT